VAGEKAGFSVILSGADDLNQLIKRDFSLRSE